jgi:galactose-1-phosphate uridylyltransferase
VAEEKGITEEEIGLIQGIVMAVSGGRVRAQFKEVRNRFQARKNKNEK